MANFLSSQPLILALAVLGVILSLYGIAKWRKESSLAKPAETSRSSQREVKSVSQTMTNSSGGIQAGHDIRVTGKADEKQKN